MRETNTQPTLPPMQQMSQFPLGLITPQAIHVAAKLGIADLVSSTPQTADELATTTSSHAPALSRLLKFLASLGIFSEDAAGKYHQTPLSDTLRTDHPQSLRGSFVAFGSEFSDDGTLAISSSRRCFSRQPLIRSRNSPTHILGHDYPMRGWPREILCTALDSYFGVKYEGERLGSALPIGVASSALYGEFRRMKLRV
jgi:hypothetical protein